MTDVVVVESPAKAKTIEKYLGEGYVVLASYGHVRDLPSKDGSVRPDENFAMTYVPDPRAAKRLDAIAKAARGAGALYLATDPDREGEAISWHVLAALKEKGAVEGVEVKRVAFNQVTRDAVLAAMRAPRDLDMDLINAQQARRALDYLVGFTLSPVLWRKLPGAKSAGRVQSVALRLICEREAEIEIFERREYWSIEVAFQTASGAPLRARLARLDGVKLDKFALPDAAAAEAAAAAIAAAASFAVTDIEAKESQRRPPPPFTTSTLQQEASRKLRLGASQTMRLAQKLYEGGLITYMRTDGVQIAGEAIAACRKLITREYGPAYLPEKPRAYRSKAKNAQEAHEAIRPTDMGRVPRQAGGGLGAEQARLYELVWKRVVASQMENARVQSTALDIEPPDRGVGLRATGSVIAFDGFLRLYKEGRDDDKDEPGGEDRVLPKVAAGEALTGARSRPASTSPSRRRGSRRLRWSSASRSSASAAPRLTPAPSRCCARATTCAWTATVLSPRAGGGWSPPSSPTSSPIMSPTSSPPTSRPVWTTSRPARRCGPMSWPLSGATSRRRSRASATSASAKCWTRSTRPSALTFSAPIPRAASRALARPVRAGG